MTNTIYKYPLLGTTRQTIQLPRGARILSAGEQNGTFVLWALVNRRETVTQDTEVLIYGTGHDANQLTDDHKFVDTVRYPNDLVFHVFALGAPVA